MKYFKRSEFACTCGCGFDTVDMDLTILVDDVREFEGAAVTVGSGCRCPVHNHEVGGEDDSKHLEGQAADLYVVDPVKTYSYLCDKYPGRYGFGLYDWGVHVDSRSNGPARWDRRTTHS